MLDHLPLEVLIPERVGGLVRPRLLQQLFLQVNRDRPTALASNAFGAQGTLRAESLGKDKCPGGAAAAVGAKRRGRVARRAGHASVSQVNLERVL